MNTAARLEGINKYFGTAISVSETTAKASAVPLRPIGRLVVKGRRDSLATFTPIADGEDALAAAYLEAYRLLAGGRPEAADAFRGVSKDFPDDALVRFHLERLAHEQPSDLIVMKDK